MISLVLAALRSPPQASITEVTPSWSGPPTQRMTYLDSGLWPNAQRTQRIPIPVFLISPFGSQKETKRKKPLSGYVDGLQADMYLIWGRVRRGFGVR